MRFSNAGLAGQKHGLAFSLFRLRPTPSQELIFLFPSDEGGHAARVERLEAARRGTWPTHRPDLHGGGDSLQVLWSQVLELEEMSNKPAGALADNDHVGLGDALQARCKIGGLA